MTAEAINNIISYYPFDKHQTTLARNQAQKLPSNFSKQGKEGIRASASNTDETVKIVVTEQIRHFNLESVFKRLGSISAVCVIHGVSIAAVTAITYYVYNFFESISKYVPRADHNIKIIDDVDTFVGEAVPSTILVIYAECVVGILKHLVGSIRKLNSELNYKESLKRPAVSKIRETVQTQLEKQIGNKVKKELADSEAELTVLTLKTTNSWLKEQSDRKVEKIVRSSLFILPSEYNIDVPCLKKNDRIIRNLTLFICLDKDRIKNDNALNFTNLVSKSNVQTPFNFRSYRSYGNAKLFTLRERICQDLKTENILRQKTNINYITHEEKISESKTLSEQLDFKLPSIPAIKQ